MTYTPTPDDAVRAISLRMADQKRLPKPEICRALRVAAGLSAADLAADLGVTRQAVSKWERGLSRPAGANLAAYIAVLRQFQVISGTDL